MTDKIFDRYNKFIEYEFSDISERLLGMPSIIGYYQSIYFTLKKKFDLYSIKLDRKWQEKYLYYKNEFNITLNNTEIKQFIEKDLEYLDIKESLQNVKTVLEQVEQTLKGLDTMQWTLKTTVEWEKFKQGSY